MSKYLICGLGNPGAEYELTRHNVGFLTLDRMVESLKTSFRTDRLGWVAEAKYKGRTLIFLKPSTFMNLSGKSVNYWLQKERIPIENLIVITDDIALPFGKLRLRAKGSGGGHNGLGNIQESLSTENYPRLRFGIGGDFPKGRQVNYVLSSFSQEELQKLPERIDKITEGVLSFVTIGIGKAMNFVNAV